MENQTGVEKLNQSPIYRHGPRVARLTIRLAMVGVIVAIFFSPAVIMPQNAKAQGACPNGGAPCAPDDMGNVGPGEICVDGCAVPAPEMSDLLVPLFILMASGMVYSIRRKALVSA